MQLSDTVFLFLFLPITLLGYYFPPVYRHKKWSTIWLLFASLVFYAWGSLIHAFLLFVSMLMNFAIGKSLEKHAKTGKGKGIVAFSCIFHFGILALSKCIGMLLSAGWLSNHTYLSTHLIPVGLSFYMFKVISYTVDIYRGKTPAQKDFCKLGLYLSFFPCVISGPIVRYNDIVGQLDDHPGSPELFREGVIRYSIGLAKSLVIGAPLGILSQTAFAREGSELSVAFAWGGALAYMLYVYFDFSGYSDMAIGLGRMFGFTFRENFNYPYLSRSVSEYWRRWHISLGEWFREYLYYPLSLGPAIKLRRRAGKYLNRRHSAMAGLGFSLLVVWICTGLWHGISLNFVVWGLINFIFVFSDSYRRPLKNAKLDAALGFLFTFLITLFTKVIFNSGSMSQAFQYYASMFHLNGNAFADAYGSFFLSEYRGYLILGLFLSFPVIGKIKARFLAKDLAAGTAGARTIVWESLQFIVVMALLIAGISCSLLGGYDPPLYANF